MIITYIEYFFRDLLTLILSIFLNIASVIHLKSYVNKKKVLVATVTHSSNNSLNKSSAESSHRVSKRVTIMVICMSCLSIMEHSLLLSCIVYFNYVQGIRAFTLGFFGNFAVILKHSLNFFFSIHSIRYLKSK